MKGSFRLNLIFWNVTVLAVFLTGFSFLSSGLSISRLRDDIDRDLRARAIHAMEPVPPPMPQPVPPGPRGPEPGGFGPGPRPGFMNRGPLPRAPQDPFFELRRPRVFNAKGVSFDPRQGDAPFDQKAVRRALAGQASFSTVAYGTERLRIYSAPYRLPDRSMGAVQVARDLRDLDLLESWQVRSLLLMLPFALGAAALGAFILAQRVLRPIGQLQQAASELSAGKMGERLNIKGSDEFARLGQTFDEMSIRLRTSFDRLTKAYDDLEAAYEKQRQFTADASHEMRTPLTRLQLATSAALRSPDADYRRALTVADQAANSLAALVDQLLILAKTDAGFLPGSSMVCDLRLAASNAVLAIEATTGRAIDVAFPSEEILIAAEDTSIQRVIQNLLLNAVRHSPNRAIEVSVNGQGDHARLVVADQGEGIPVEALPRVFERFYRADQSRTATSGGTGLGLAICKGIVEAYHGTIEIASQVNEGTQVTILFPLVKKDSDQTISS